jgi:thioredoxin 1
MQVIINFGATWFGPCRAIDPIFEALSDRYAVVAFYSVDIDGAPVSMSALLLRFGSDACLFQNGSALAECCMHSRILTIGP